MTARAASAATATGPAGATATGLRRPPDPRATAATATGRSDSRGYGDRPQGERRYGDRPTGERRYGDRPQGDRQHSDRPQGERRYGDRPTGDRGYGDRPTGERRYADRDTRGYGDRPQGERRFGDRPQFGDRDGRGDRPTGERRFGDRDTRGGFRPESRVRDDRPRDDRPRRTVRVTTGVGSAGDRQRVPTDPLIHRTPSRSPGSAAAFSHALPMSVRSRNVRLMPTMPKSIFWSRTDTAGSEQALFDDGHGLTARGTLLAVDPIP